MEGKRNAGDLSEKIVGGGTATLTSPAKPQGKKAKECSRRSPTIIETQQKGKKVIHGYRYLKAPTKTPGGKKR